MESAAQGGSALQMLVPFLLIIAVFYFIVILPARKQQKRKDQMIANLKKGDRVVTSGGIHGTVSLVEEQSLLIKVADNVKIRVSKGAVSGTVGDGGATSA
ncbi:MAG: preprotein translocase subunit YajC [bacterium]|nr:preprotein translocase subunit YajC [bacterium]